MMMVCSVIMLMVKFGINKKFLQSIKLCDLCEFHIKLGDYYWSVVSGHWISICTHLIENYLYCGNKCLFS